MTDFEMDPERTCGAHSRGDSRFGFVLSNLKLGLQVTPEPMNITAIGNTPTQITHCYADQCNTTYFQPDAQIGNCAFRIEGKSWNPTCCDLPDQNCTDLWLADAAVRTLHTVAADKTKPFALFVGFHKPHPFWDVSVLAWRSFPGRRVVRVGWVCGGGMALRDPHFTRAA